MRKGVFVLAIGIILVGGCVEQMSSEINLVIAASEGDLDKVKIYATQVESLNFVSAKGDTPLGAAASNGNLEVVRFLIEAGADADLRNEYGQTALDSAEENGHEEVRLFLERLND